MQFDRTPSQLTEADVVEFQRLVFDECGVELPIADAWEQAIKLVAMFRAILGPIPEDRSTAAQSYPQGAPIARSE